MFRTKLTLAGLVVAAAFLGLIPHSALAVATPAAVGAGKPQGSSFITDTLGSLGHGMTSVVAGTPRASAQDYRFVSDTLGSLGHGMTSVVAGNPVASLAGPPVPAAQQPSGFHWADAGVGAGTAVGGLLVLLGGSLLVARRHSRLAI
jgi:hypothetical protein